MEPAAPQEINQHIAALAKLFPFRHMNSVLLVNPDGSTLRRKPIKQPGSSRTSLLGAERSLVVNVAAKAHFRQMKIPMKAEQVAGYW
jgi:hypothetical protein